MLRHLVINPKTINRLAIMGILPLMVLSILAGTRGGNASGNNEPIEQPREGTLVVANLRGKSLTIHELGGNGEPQTLVLAAAPHELVEAAGRVYATLPREDAIVEVDPRAPGVLRSLEAGPMVHGLALVDEATLVATLDASRLVATIDRATMTAMSAASTGDTPHTVASFDGSYFVTDSRDGTVRRIDPATGRTIAIADAGQLPESVAIAGDAVVVADATGGDLYWFTPELAPMGRIHLGGTPVRVIALDAHRVAISLNADAHVAIVDLTTGGIEKSIRVAGHPDGLCASPSGRFLAIASNEHDSVNIFRTTDWKLMVTLSAGDGPGACTWF